jgi:hypothetical protein
VVAGFQRGVLQQANRRDTDLAYLSSKIRSLKNMNESELQARNLGFMTAIGLLLMHSDTEVQEAIKTTLSSFGSGLYLELDNDSYQQLAAAQAPNPCPPGMKWDPVLRACVVPSDP